MAIACYGMHETDTLRMQGLARKGTDVVNALLHQTRFAQGALQRCFWRAVERISYQWMPKALRHMHANLMRTPAF